MSKKIYIRNLNQIMDSYELEALFSTMGDVTSASVNTEVIKGHERRVGHVEMSTEQAALDCIERFHGREEGGLIWVVTKDSPHVPTTKAKT